MDTKPTSSSTLKERILRGSNPDMISLDSLEEMEKALDHADKLTVTMGEVNLGECYFTAPTFDKMDKSPKLMCAGIGGCPFCEHEEAIRQEKDPYRRRFFTPKECGVGASSKRSLIKRNKP